MKLRKKSKKTLYQLLIRLPFDLLGKYARKKFHTSAPKGIRKEIIFKIADTKDELNQAFTLLQETYVEAGLANDVDERMRVLKYNLLPTTTVYIAKYKNEVVGTVSHVLDSEFGLPIEKFIDINKIHKRGGRRCEISGLAVHPKWRSKRKGVFFPLILVALKYSYETIGIDRFYLICNFTGKLFYKNILMVDELEQESTVYASANNAEAYAQYIDMKEVINRLKNNYSSKYLYRNLYMLWCVLPWRKNCRFPKRSTHLATTVNPTLEKQQWLFVKENIDRFSDVLTENEKAHIKNMYHQVQEEKEIIERKNNRYLVNLNIHFVLGENLLKVRVNDISLSGFTVLVDEPEYIPKKIVGRFMIHGVSDLLVKGSLVWSRNNKAGFKITMIDSVRWRSYIHAIEAEYDVDQAA